LRVVASGRSAALSSRPDPTVIEASVLDMTDTEMAQHVDGRDAAVSCLGHVMDFRDIFRALRSLP